MTRARAAAMVGDGARLVRNEHGAQFDGRLALNADAVELCTMSACAHSLS